MLSNHIPCKISLTEYQKPLYSFTIQCLLALTVCRQKNRHTDCTQHEPETNPLEAHSPSASDANMVSQMTQTQGNSNGNHIFEPFYNILMKTHVRVFCCAINQIEVGLPLQETVPKDSYATDRISADYFLPSPVFLCLYANQPGDNAADFFHTKYDIYLNRIYMKQKLSTLPLQNSNCSIDNTKITPSSNITQLETHTYYNRGMYIINANGYAEQRTAVQNVGAMYNC